MLRACAIVCSLLLSACKFETALPEGAQIECAGALDCPAGYVCKPAIQRCVPLDALDDEPPAIVEATVTVSGKAGDAITAQFRVSEPLSRAPAVRIAGGAAFELLDTLDDGLRFEFARELDGTERDGVHTVVADLVDVGGNPAREQQVGTTELDFTAPIVVPGSVAIRIVGSAEASLDRIDVPLAAAGAGSIVQVSLVASEPLIGPPRLTLDGDDVPFSLATGPVGTTWVLERIIDESVAEGDRPITFELEDVVGNRTIEHVDGVEPVIIDVTPPLFDPSVLVYRRLPWGGDETAAQRAFEVRAEDLLEPNTTLVLFDEDGRAGGAELGRSRVAANGFAPPVALAAGDRVRVYASLVDDAGNADRPIASLVARQEWIASLAGKVAGSRFPNPHRALAAPRAPHVLAADDATELSGDALAMRDTEVVRSNGADRWRRVATEAPQPTPGGYGSLAGDTRRGGALHIGGSDTTRTWRDTWRTVSTDERLLLSSSSVAFDPRRDRFVALSQDILGSGVLLELGADGWRTAPIGLSSAALAFDPSTGRVLMADGAQNVVLWNGTTMVFSNAGQPLSLEEQLPILATDPLRQRVLCARPGPTVIELLAWEGQGFELLSTASAPPTREAFGLAFDPTRDRFILVGGRLSAAAQRDAWALDPVALSWTRIADLPGDAGLGASAAFDGEHIVTVTGVGGAQTFVLEGDRWLRAARGQPPLGAMVDGSFAFSPRDGQTFIMEATTALWSFDGREWRTRTPQGGSPVMRGPLAFHDTRDELVMVAGPDVWALSDDTWSVALAGGAPAPQHTVAYDPDRDEVVVFGVGAQQDETWVWDASGSWVERQPVVHPEGRVGHALVWDGARRRVVLFGGASGESDRDDTWTWDGSEWTELALASRPPGRALHSLAWDSYRERVVMFGGADVFSLGVITLGDDYAWELDDIGWHRIETGLRPAARYGAGMTFDDVHGAAVMFGGALYDSYPGVSDFPPADTWLFESGGAAQPALVFAFDLSSMGVPLATASGTSLTVRATLGGDSLSGPGADIAVYVDGAWLVLAETTSTAAAPTDVTALVSAPIGAMQVDGAELFVRARSRGAAGRDGGVVVDAIELEVATVLAE